MNDATTITTLVNQVAGYASDVTGYILTIATAFFAVAALYLFIRHALKAMKLVK